MIISNSRSFVFIHLEKCGGTSVEVALDRLLSWNDVAIGSTQFGEAVQDAYGKRWSLHKHSDARDIHQVIGAESWRRMYKFATVRHPFDIVVSLYYFSRSMVGSAEEEGRVSAWREAMATPERFSHWPYARKFVRAYCLSQLEGSGFPGFVEACLASRDPALRPQVERLSLSEQSYPGCRDMDLLVDLSHLERRWPEILRAMGVTSADCPPLGHENASIKRGSAAWHFRDPGLRHMVRQHFALDWEFLPPATGSTWAE